MALRVTLNGRDENLVSLEDGSTLADAIALLGMKADRVAVERNGEIVPRMQWDTVRVISGDKLEVVHFVGGGKAIGEKAKRGQGMDSLAVNYT